GNLQRVTKPQCLRVDTLDVAALPGGVAVRDPHVAGRVRGEPARRDSANGGYLARGRIETCQQVVTRVGAATAGCVAENSMGDPDIAARDDDVVGFGADRDDLRRLERVGVEADETVRQDPDWGLVVR